MRLEHCPLCGGRRLGKHRDVYREYLNQQYVLELLKCEACDFIALREEPEIKYDASYIEHELVLTTQDPLIDLKARERVASIAEVVRPGQAVSLLDVGIGDGRLLYRAEGAGYRTYGLDINRDGVREACAKFRLKANISLAPLAESFPRVIFDVIHMSEVIEHLRDPLQILAVFRQRLSPAGCLVVQTGNISSLAARLSGQNWEYIRPMHVSYFSTTTLRSALRKSGFRVERTLTTDWRWGSVWRQARAFFQEGRGDVARSLLSLRLTAALHGVRRTVVAYARPD